MAIVEGIELSVHCKRRASVLALYVDLHDSSGRCTFYLLVHIRTYLDLRLTWSGPQQWGHILVSAEFIMFSLSLNLALLLLALNIEDHGQIKVSSKNLELTFGALGFRQQSES